MAKWRSKERSTLDDYTGVVFQNVEYKPLPPRYGPGSLCPSGRRSAQNGRTASRLARSYRLCWWEGLLSTATGSTGLIDLSQFGLLAGSLLGAHRRPERSLARPGGRGGTGGGRGAPISCARRDGSGLRNCAEKCAWRMASRSRCWPQSLASRVRLKRFLPSPKNGGAQSRWTSRFRPPLSQT